MTRESRDREGKGRGGRKLYREERGGAGADRQTDRQIDR